MNSSFRSLLFSFFLLSSILHPRLSANPETEGETTGDDDAFFEEWLRGDDLLDLDNLGPGNLAAPSLWEGEAKISTGAGYRDNALMSPTDPKGGGFLFGSLQASALRLGERVRLSLFGNIEHLEFDKNLPGDSFASFFSLANIPLQNDKSVNIATQAFWMDQVVEVETLGGTDQRTRVRSSGLELIPSLRTDWANSTFSEAFLLASRMMSHDDEVSNYWEIGSRVAAGWSAANSTLTLSLTYREHHFDDRPALTAEGTLIEGAQVKFRLLEPGAAFRHAWGKKGQWQSNSGLGIEHRRDNQTDYFSYDRIRASQQIRYRVADWEFEASVRYSHYSYKVQRTSEESLRRRELWGGRLEVRRSLTEELDVFGRYDRDTSDSNDRADAYDTNTWTVGMGWQF